MGEAAGKGKERRPQVRLGDVCDIYSGSVFPLEMQGKKEGKYPFYKVGDISKAVTSGYVYLLSCDNHIDDDDVKSLNAKILPKNTVVFAKIGAALKLNRRAIVSQPCLVDNNAIGIKAKTDIISDIYLYHFLKSVDLCRYSRETAIPSVKTSDIKQIPIPLPPLPEQRRIAAVLDQVSSLIALRKAQLAKLDLLVKARFVEMFGDPVKNEMGWNIVSLDEIAEISSGITKGRKTKEQDLKKVPYLSVSNVKDGYIDVSHVKTILATQNEIKQYKLLPYDVLMTEGGDPDKLGRGAILYQPPENCIHQNHIFRVRFDKNKINPVFFEEYLKHPAAKKYFLKCAKQTTGIATINMKQLSSLPVLLPPLEHQHVFSQFKQDTLKLKLAYNQTLEKLEILMKSLSLEYFG